MNKGLSMVGLATRARGTVSGEFATEKAVKERKAKLVIVASDASDNTKKLFRNKCEYYKIPFFIVGTKEELGKVTGGVMRASLAVTDARFSDTIIEKLQQNEI
ncbi:MAG: L7Ae/L30e/S12e/Gadd45 family ribosomal protein [Lachnospiraceae bacterium]|jgi:ribosomal protein L7Ae-like RNA K-turn-binding protein|nr:L7Ae/L30e/S12e/Gadd45 family ribosomal protein [Lachnospiraceae bacterium]